MQDGKESSIQYLAERAFSLDSVPKNVIDLILTQAAFEHIKDVPLFSHCLTKTVNPGAILCAEIDLQTHSRWIREKDPNNIYRFPALLYRMLRYAGIPNRLRSEDYREFLVANGWKNIQIIVLRSIDEQAQDHTLRGLNKSFANKDMKLLSVVILATRGSPAVSRRAKGSPVPG